jgi:hypothetical protein
MRPETNPPCSAEPYSLAADLLSKFHTSPEWIQALWLIAIPALIFGLAYLLKEMVVALARTRDRPPETLLYTIHRQDDDLLVIRHGHDALALDNESLTAPAHGRERVR